MIFRTEDIKNYITAKSINWDKTVEQLNAKLFETTYNNNMLEVDVLPNRYSDLSSLVGFSRELHAVCGCGFKEPKIKLKESRKLLENFMSVSVKTPLCKQYFGRMVFGVKNKQSPKWLAEFVRAYGFNSVNLIVDLSNFVMIEYGAPLHVFDADTIPGKKIIVREAESDESFRSLSDKNILVSKGAVVIADETEVLALAGIQGGWKSQTTLKTKNIFIEAAVFDPTSIYRTSRAVKLQTDSSYRFERKVVRENAIFALDRLTALIQEHAGGEIARGKVEHGKEQLKKLVTVLFEKVRSYSGINISAQEIENLILKTGSTIIKKTKIALTVVPPAFRLDLAIPEDFIEEVVRLYGLSHITSVFSSKGMIAREDEMFALQDIVRSLLVQSGCFEFVGYSFIADTEEKILQKTIQDLYGKDTEAIYALNPMSQLHSVYRSLLFPTLVKNLKENAVLAKDLRVCEIGNIGVYKGNNIIEASHAAYAISMPRVQDALLEGKGLARLLFERLGISVHIKNSDIAGFEIAAKMYGEENQDFGYIGLLEKELSSSYDIDQRVVVAEFDLNEILKVFTFDVVFQAIPEFPAIVRDVSYVVQETMPVNYIEQELRHGGTELLERVELVDVYQGGEIEKDKKSITFRLVFRAKDRSLKDTEINSILQGINKELISRYNVVLR